MIPFQPTFTNSHNIEKEIAGCVATLKYLKAKAANLGSNKVREIPNPHSILLSNAVVGAAGVALPPDIEPPISMAPILLFVPIDEMRGKSMSQIQEDLGLPWAGDDGNGALSHVWFDKL